MEDMRKFSDQQLYELMCSCQSPGYYQFCVEELQRRFLTEIGVQTQKLADSSACMEALTAKLTTTVSNVGVEIQSLTESSNRMERLTKRLMWLTIALFLLAAVQVAILLKDEFFPKGRPGASQTAVTVHADHKSESPHGKQ